MPSDGEERSPLSNQDEADALQRRTLSSDRRQLTRQAANRGQALVVKRRNVYGDAEGFTILQLFQEVQEAKKELIKPCVSTSTWSGTVAGSYPAFRRASERLATIAARTSW